MYDDLLSKLKEKLLELFDPLISDYSEDPVGMTLAIVTIAVFVVEFVLLNKGIIFSRGKKRVEKAERDGRTLEATRVSFRRSQHTNTNGNKHDWWIARYEYVLEGKRRTKVVSSKYSQDLTSTMTLYYKESGKKAYTYGEFSNEPFFFLIYFIPFVVSGVIGWLIGYYH